MGVVRFYHMTRSPVEATLARLAQRAYEAGLRVEIRASDPARLDWLDQKLWLGDESGFLPHGQAGGPHDALQPVLLTASETLAPDTQCLMAIDGAPVEAAEAARLDRTFVLFDGNDPPALDHARGQWRMLTGAGAEAEYWSEDSGRWERKA
ncbi:MAG: DNA polymerase III subunit chi [Rhodobacteraceae bacterium]|nr:DNA polymerase III subunit chi [Paracoccaceae bacterium]